MYRPGAGHARSRLHVGVDVSVPAADAQPVESAPHPDVAISAAGVQRAVESLALDIAVLRGEARITPQTIRPDIAVARVDIGSRLTGNLQFDPHPVAPKIEMQRRNLHFDFHTVAALMA